MQTQPVIHVAFRYGFWDRWRSTILMVTQNWQTMVMALVFPMVGVAIVAFKLYLHDDWGWGDVALITGAVVFTPLIAAVNAAQASCSAAGKKLCRYDFSDSGVRTYDETADLNMSWDAFLQVKHQGGFLLLFVTPRCAHCVPTRALAEKGQLDAVIELAKRHGVPRRVRRSPVRQAGY